MLVSVTDAKAQLTELVRRAEAGEEVILTRHGHPAVQLIPRGKEESAEALRTRRRAMLERLRGSAKDAPGFDGVEAARATDFLYDENGLPA